MKKLLSILALLALGICAQAQSTNYPTTTTPESGDNEVLTLKKQLRILNDAKTGTAPLTTTATPTGAAQLTPSFASATSSGNTTAGKHVLTFILSSDFVGTIGGVAFTGAADSFLELRAPEGFTFAAVAYTRSAGTVRVIQF